MFINRVWMVFVTKQSKSVVLTSNIYLSLSREHFGLSEDGQFERGLIFAGDIELSNAKLWKKISIKRKKKGKS